MNATFLQMALGYRARGWHLFPVHSVDAARRCTCGEAKCKRAGKHPRTDNGFLDATNDLAQIEAWFGPDAPASNIGIRTGATSGITVIDVDTAEGKKGTETWAGLIAEKGEPQTLMAKSGSGGFHLFFQYNSALKNGPNALGPNVDCLNDGGYIIAPPSKHRTGGVYAWDEDLPLAPVPANLLPQEKRGRPRKDDPTRRKYGLEEVAQMLEVVSADGYKEWRDVGIILGREFNLSDGAWKLYNEWAGKWTGKKDSDHDKTMREAFYKTSQEEGEKKELTLGTIVHAALKAGWQPKGGEVPIERFVFYGPGNHFIYRINGSAWVAEAVNAAVSPVNVDGRLVKAAEWLRDHALATSMTSDPNLEGDYVRGYDYRKGVQIPAQGAATFNIYRPSELESGDAQLAGPFVEHVKRLLPRPGDADQFFNYMAHRAQRPGEKPRFALLIAGEQGVGKDTAVSFCCPAFGQWNVAAIEPAAIDSNFNEHAAHVLIRIAEAANQHDMTKFAFNEKLKVLIAGEPDHVDINPKYGRMYSVRLHCGVILTTNHLLTGIYIPPDDRRYDVMECATKAGMDLEDAEKCRSYFDALHGWAREGGFAHVAAFLRGRDISRFSVTMLRKTLAHAAVVSANLAQDHWLIDALVELGEPDLVRSDAITSVVMKSGNGMAQQEVARRMSAALTRTDYELAHNPERKDGRWRLGKPATQVLVYAKKGLNLSASELGARIANLGGQSF